MNEAGDASGGSEWVRLFFKAWDLLAFAIQIRTENGDLGREERCMHAREELRKAQLVMAWLSRQETFSGHLT